MKRFNKSVGLVKLDVEKASDSVWHDGLIFKLKTKFNFPQTLWKLIDSFVRGREFIVYVNGSKSKKKEMAAGLAQGTVLNPLLYTIFMSDIPIPSNVELAMFADDIAIYTSGYDPNDIINDLNQALNRMRDYFLQWKIKINATKLQAIIFPMTRQAVKPTNNILYEDTIVQLEKSIKYLGVTLDEMLKFEEHIDVVIDKAVVSIEKFFPLLQPNSQLSTETKLFLYITIIRPIMTHGSPVCSKATPNSLNKLYILQNEIFKMFLKFPSWHSIMLMKRRYRVPHLSSYLKRVNERFADKCKESSYELISDIDHRICMITIAR